MRFKFVEWLLITESKKSIIELGYPEIIAKLLYEKFGRNAPLIAKWYKEDVAYPDENWWDARHFSTTFPSLSDLTNLYKAAANKEDYIKALDKLDLSRENESVYDDIYLREQREALKEQIAKTFFSNSFFNVFTLVQDIMTGKLKNVAPYKNLPLREAQRKYDQKNIFQQRKPLKVYRNGYKWIDVGRQCNLVADLMKNCGRVGLMSWDKDATIIALFDSEGKPHVVTTYSPNEQRLSGDQGVAGSEVKPEYHEYIIDLANFLNAEFDVAKTSSSLLRLRYLLQGKATNIKKINDNFYNQLFQFDMNGETYYANRNIAVSKDDVERVRDAVQKGELKIKLKDDIIETVLHEQNQPALTNFGVKYLWLRDLA